MTEKKTVFIKIQGLCATGKTSMAAKIGRALRELGINTSVWELDDRCDQDLSPEAVDRNLKALAPKIDVIIETQQLKRLVLPK